MLVFRRFGDTATPRHSARSQLYAGPQRSIPVGTTRSTTLRRRRPLGPLGRRNASAGPSFTVASGEDDQELC